MTGPVGEVRGFVADCTLPGGVATGIGSMPGVDVAETVRRVFGEVPDFPYLPELPDRGPGADLIGRGASLLIDLPVQLYAGRWQMASRPGVDVRRAQDFLERDLDTVTEIGADHDGPFKLAAAGPWTLAVALQRRTGGAMLGDPGAVADLAASLAEGLALHIQDVAERLPRARPVLQLDEPSLPAVLAGTVATESGFSRHRPVEPAVAGELLSAVISAVNVPVVVHCCAPSVPVTLLREAGAVAVAMDLTLLDVDSPAEMDALGEALDGGLGLFAGAAGTGPDAPEPMGREVADVVDGVWRRWGLEPDRRREQVVVTPACGLAGHPWPRARAILAACVEAARRLRD